MNLGICVQCILNLAEMLQHSDFVCMSKALNRLDFGAPMLHVIPRVIYMTLTKMLVNHLYW